MPLQFTEEKDEDNRMNQVDQSPVDAESFIDTPLLLAKRSAFDDPTQANLDVLIAVAQAKWQPIETAPTYPEMPILLWTPHTMAVGYFDNGEWWILGARGTVIEATHWRPLPEPPGR